MFLLDILCIRGMNSFFPHICIPWSRYYHHFTYEKTEVDEGSPAYAYASLSTDEPRDLDPAAFSLC